MKEITTGQVTAAVRQLCIDACCLLDENITTALKDARAREQSALSRDILDVIIKNAALARETLSPCCQDTGLAVVHVRLGQEVHIAGGSLAAAIDEGVRQGYRDGYLRKSVVSDPLLRKNTGDNTPAMVTYEVVEGDQLELTVLPKGAGSENMSALKMLTPADGAEGVKRFVLQTLEQAGGKPCPPVVVGVGIGGTMDKAALIAKLSLERPIGQRSPLAHIAALETELLEEANRLGIGTLGLGGTVTALDVHIETMPTHIACLPVAVNLQCHAYRHARAVL